jgi:hypothetical protein
MSMGDAGNVASIGNLAVGGPSLLGPAGIGLGFASSVLGGKGGKAHHPVAGGSPGAYTLDNKPWGGVDDYQIQGDNGTYNLLPEINATSTRDSLYGKLNGDALAQQLFNKRFPQQTQSPVDRYKTNSGMMGRMTGIGAPAPQYRPNLNLSLANRNHNAVNGDPLGAANLAQMQINSTPQKFTDYARGQQHPFFTPK